MRRYTDIGICLFIIFSLSPSTSCNAFTFPSTKLAVQQTYHNHELVPFVKNVVRTNNHHVRNIRWKRRNGSLFVKEELRQQEKVTVYNNSNNTRSKENNDKDGDVMDDVSSLSISSQSSSSSSLSLSIQQYIQQNIFLGIQPTPEILSIMSIYFVEGALGLSKLAQTFYLKDTLHLNPVELSALTGIFTLPWTIKPLYGFLSDGVPLLGYRRRSYLILCGLLGSFCYFALGSDFFGILDNTSDGNVEGPITLIQATIASFVISSGCIAFSDVVADGIVVQRTRDSNDPKVAGMFGRFWIIMILFFITYKYNTSSSHQRTILLSFLLLSFFFFYERWITKFVLGISCNWWIDISIFFR